jgi:hypothetical protein
VKCRGSTEEIEKVITFEGLLDLEGAAGYLGITLLPVDVFAAEWMQR